MLISGGKVLAIDKVNHDSTLTGDGRFGNLGVDLQVILTKVEAGSVFQPKGSYVYTSAMSGYYTKTAADQKFATLAGTYSVESADATFQKKGDYATETELGDLQKWISRTYMTSADVVKKYATTSLVASTSAQVKTEIETNYDAKFTTLEEHVENSAIHLSESDRAFLGNLSAYDFGDFVTVDRIPAIGADGKTVYGIVYDKSADTWSFNAIQDIGGGSVDVTVTGENGVTAEKNPIEFGDDYWHVGLDETLKTASATWDTVTGKLDATALGDYYKSAEIDALLDKKQDLLSAGDGIEITSSEDVTTISFTGKQGNVDIVETTAAATSEDKIYLVLEEV